MTTERVEFTRDCEAIQIPAGTATTIEQGTEAYVTQSLGVVHVAGPGAGRPLSHRRA